MKCYGVDCLNAFSRWAEKLTDWPAKLNKEHHICLENVEHLQQNIWATWNSSNSGPWLVWGQVWTGDPGV